MTKQRGLLCLMPPGQTLGGSGGSGGSRTRKKRRIEGVAVPEKKINTILQKNIRPCHANRDKLVVINTNTFVQSNDARVVAIIVIKIISAIAQ